MKPNPRETIDDLFWLLSLNNLDVDLGISKLCGDARNELGSGWWNDTIDRIEAYARHRLKAATTQATQATQTTQMTQTTGRK